MENVGVFADALHAFSQACLIPVIIVLALLVLYAVFNVGTLIAEYFTERRLLKAKLPSLLDHIDECETSSLKDVVDQSGLLARQRDAINELIAHTQLPIDSLVALAKRLIEDEQERYSRITARTDMVAKLGPIFGLMGTLIPLGPGILALSTGDTATLSEALLIAFDTTVVGLIAAAIALVVSKTRSLWYEGYMASLEAVLTAVLKRIEDLDDDDKRLLSGNAGGSIVEKSSVTTRPAHATTR